LLIGPLLDCLAESDAVRIESGVSCAGEGNSRVEVSAEGTARHIPPMGELLFCLHEPLDDDDKN